MAAKPPRPPRILLTSQEPSDSYKYFQNERSNCSCTNISIMQLFHEMKQEFPTIPDYVVNQYVFDNCHNRENCIQSLKQELISYPAQAYPSHALRNNQNLMCNKPPLKPSRPAPPAPCDSKKVNSVKKFGTDTTCNKILVNDIRPQSNISGSKINAPSQRPTALKFHKPANKQFSNNGNHRPVSRPVRPPPLPPRGKQPPANVQNIDQSFNSLLIQSPVSCSDSGESVISVNISLSPTSEQSQGSRRISAISIQPEPPYSRDFSPQSPRSFTSLNLTLRKPSATPQSPIDITAGQGLTYSSSSFDARRGYQKNFHITVTDQGGVFSASRIRPRSGSTTIHEDGNLTEDQHKYMNNLSPEQNPNKPIERHTAGLASEQDRLELVRRQRLKKEKLVKALELNVKELEREEHEINVLTSPLKPDETQRLDSIIKELSGGCLELINILERFDNADSSDMTDNQQANFQSNLLRHEPPHRTAPCQQSNLNLFNYGVQDETPIAVQQPQSLGPTVENEYFNINEVETEPPWTCSMCTFQNHPLLNKCECCDNIKIIPGTIRIVPSNCNNSSPMFSRLSSNLTSITNNVDSNNFNNTDSYPAVIMSPPNQNCLMPGNG